MPYGVRLQPAESFKMVKNEHVSSRKQSVSTNLEIVAILLELFIFTVLLDTQIGKIIEKMGWNPTRLYSIYDVTIGY